MDLSHSSKRPSVVLQALFVVEQHEHLIFYQAFKEKVYMSLHGLQDKSAIANGHTRLLSKYAKEGNKTQVCTHNLSKEEIFELAAGGEPAAILWSQFQHWLPLI